MSIELKDGWNGPMKLTVKACAKKGVKQDGTGIQWIGKFPPHSGLLQWDTIFEETGNSRITVSSANAPENGTVFEGVFVKQKENAANPQYPNRTLYTKEEKENASGPRGGSGGPSTNLSKAEEIRVHSLMIAATHIGNALNADGTKVLVKQEALYKLADGIQEDILAAGKKAEA